MKEHNYGIDLLRLVLVISSIIFISELIIEFIRRKLFKILKIEKSSEQIMMVINIVFKKVKAIIL